MALSPEVSAVLPPRCMPDSLSTEAHAAATRRIARRLAWWFKFMAAADRSCHVRSTMSESIDTSAVVGGQLDMPTGYSFASLASVARTNDIRSILIMSNFFSLTKTYRKEH